MLLSMTSGLGDYNDTTIRLWTQAHAPKDIAPHTYLSNMSHTLPFTPGKGAQYSGNGFVLAGMVLAAATGAKRWQDLDQVRTLPLFFGRGFFFFSLLSFGRNISAFLPRFLFICGGFTSRVHSSLKIA